MSADIMPETEPRGRDDMIDHFRSVMQRIESRQLLGVFTIEIADGRCDWSLRAPFDDAVLLAVLTALYEAAKDINRLLVLRSTERPDRVN